MSGFDAVDQSDQTPCRLAFDEAEDSNKEKN